MPKSKYRQPNTLTPQEWEEYKKGMADIITQGRRDYQNLTPEMRLEDPTGGGEFIKARVRALRQSLGLSPFPNSDKNFLREFNQ